MKFSSSLWKRIVEKRANFDELAYIKKGDETGDAEIIKRVQYVWDVNGCERL